MPSPAPVFPDLKLCSQLPAEAYFDRAWFEREQHTVTAPTWHRCDQDADSQADQVAGSQTDDGSASQGTFAWWEGMCFGSSQPATTLGEALGELPNLIGSHQPSKLAEIAAVDLEGTFNWKLFIENHLDVLHLWYLHRDTLGDFDHAAFNHQHSGANWASFEPLRPAAGGPGTDAIRHLDERDRNGLGAHLLFPDTPMAAGANYFATYRARPVSPEHTVVELRAMGEPHADPDPIVAEIVAFITEDIKACEEIQRAVRSRHFEVGPLARSHEAPVVRFQKDLLQLMEREGALR